MAAYLKALLNKKTTLYLAGFFLLLLVYTLTRHTVDYLNFWKIARETVYGNIDLYKRYIAFSYPPFFYNIIIFFAIFPVKVSLALWYCFSVTILTFSIAMILKLIYPESTFFRFDSKSRTKMFLPFILALPIVADNLYLGQANIFVFFLCVSAIYLLENKNPIASGLFIAAAAAIKLTPAFFIIYFLYRKEYKAVIATLIGLPVFFLIIPSLFYGFERAWYLSGEFVKLVVFPFFKNDAIIRETVYYTHPNQSLDAFLVRHFTDLGIVNYPGWLHSHLDISKFSQEQMKRVGLIVKAVLLLLSAAALWRTRKFKLVARFEYAIVFFLILYISPSSWLSHYITVLFAYYVSVGYITDIYADRIGKLILTLCLALAIIFTYTGVNPFMQSFSGMFIGNFVLFLGMIFVCFKESYRKAL
ncbi:MAG: hypothetical protein A2452_08445 [Candidatus Firestonebacteria bacterium RIFOXYC2_FULL_39_67]|nr:MAG: hypothetical protein A2536_05430 [Candidatus Firestonebacteria bacterium RIFOXYD2_FULL_39_29]OGF56943.1 MAG: hypothetical protein A2452_08445 [Candidatus Firestonebacteria bacterium RIFOXYC2_FULL_39_67]